MNYITLDLETTGVDVQRDKPIQFAWVVHNSYNVRQTATKFLVNNQDIKVDPFIENLTGITNEEIREKGISPATAVQRYNTAVWSFQPAILVGYNLINFDLPILQNFLCENVPGRFKFPPLAGIWDVMHLCSKFFKTKKWLKLAEAGKKLDILFDADRLHDALADVNLTWAIFQELKERKAF